MITCEYIPVPEAALEDLIKLGKIREWELIYDLGCGTGEFLIKAAGEHGARGVGIEVSRRLARWARTEVEKRNLGNKIKIICDNFFFPKYWAHLEGGEDKPHAIRKADVVYIYLTLQVQEALKPMLEKELKPGARVISYAFKLMSWKPARVEMLRQGDSDVPLYVFEKGKSF